MRPEAHVRRALDLAPLHSVSPEEAECDDPVAEEVVDVRVPLHSVSPEEAECDGLTRTSLIPTPYASTCERSNPRRIRLLASRGVQHPISLDAAHASGPWSGRCAGPLATGRCLRRFAGLPMPPSGGQNVKDVRC